MIIKIGKFQMSFGRHATPARNNEGNMIRGKYDAAQTNHMNQRHWANADNLSADQANSPSVRQILRNRSRYEISNNAYLCAMVEGYANEVVGTGPRMEFLDPNATINMDVENAWLTWFEEIDGPDLVKMAFQTAVGDGESFMVQANGNNVRSQVQLDYVMLDAERCSNSTEGFGILSDKNIDGVILNDIGKPIAYDFSERHPGASFMQTGFFKSKRLPKSAVIHFFKANRPEQHRGIPEITTALPLGAKLRSYSLSTIEAAKIAASFSGVLHTQSNTMNDSLSNTGSAGDGQFKSMEEFELQNGMMLVLPDGWDMKQVKAEHPTSTYKEFKRAIVAEMSRSLLMPYNVAAGDSSGYNYASGRLDRLTWRKVLKIRQKQVERKILQAMFFAWWDEAILIDGVLPQRVRRLGYTPIFKWFFDGDAAIDPEKESKADRNDLESKATNYAEIYARKGKNWKTEFAQIAEEEKEAEKLGIKLFQPNPILLPDPDEEETEEEEEEATA